MLTLKLAIIYENSICSHDVTIFVSMMCCQYVVYVHFSASL